MRRKTKRLTDVDNLLTRVAAVNIANTTLTRKRNTDWRWIVPLVCIVGISSGLAVFFMAVLATTIFR